MLDVMREAGKPLYSREITAMLLARKGIEATDAQANLSHQGWDSKTL